MNAATGLGYYILAHGAETYRVEESIRRICAAYGKAEADVFVIPSSIVVTIPTENGRFLTKSRRLLARDTDLDKVDQLGDLSRRICREKPDYQAILEEFERIRNRPSYSYPQQVGAVVLISFCFTLFYGGGLQDAICGGIIGLLLKLLLKKLEELSATSFFANILGGGMVAFLARFAVAAGVAFNTDKMIIGVLMNLVPGIALTNSMRDFIAGDLIAGMIKLTEALLVAGGIAIGVMFSLAYLAPWMEVFF